MLLFLLLSTIASLPSNLVLASDDNDDNDKKIWLPGATGSGPFDVAKVWATAFGALYPEAHVTLSSVGSGAAQKALWGDIDCHDKPVQAICGDHHGHDHHDTTNNQATVWGLGDAPIKATVYEEHPLLQLQQFPACAGAMAIVYSKEVTESFNDADAQLKMDFDVLSGIFNTSIIYWDDPQIQALNPTLTIPHERISKLVREDSSGQTSIVTDALDFQVPSWPSEAVGTEPDWPLGPLAHPGDLTGQSYCVETSTNETTSNVMGGRPYSFAADGKHGISLGLLRVPYSIGYLEMGSLERLTEFLQQVQMGTSTADDSSSQVFVDANPKSLLATMDGLSDQLSPDTLELNLARAETPPGGFPIGGYAYWYIKKTPDAYTDCYQAWLLCKMVEWSYTDPLAGKLALDHGWVVPPAAVANHTLERLQDVMCYNIEVSPPQLISALSYTPPPYRSSSESDLLMSTTISVAAVIIVVILGLWLLDRRRKRLGDENLWRIKESELTYDEPTPQIIGQGKFGVVLLAEYRGTQVAVKRVIPPSSSNNNDSNSNHNNNNSNHKSRNLSLGLSMHGLPLTAESSHTTTMMSSGAHFTGLSSSGYVPNRNNNQKKTLNMYDNFNNFVGINWGLMSGSFVKGILTGTAFASSPAGGSPHNSGSGSGGNRDFRKMKQDFREEVRYLSKLRHPCVTTVMGAVMGDNPMLVMEYMLRGSLYVLLHNETMVMDGDLAVPILRDISSGCRYLHAAEPSAIIHCDLKSANILVDDKFRAKVADFGLSPKGNYGTGTPYWMAPELLRGESGNTTATDVYSFGIILFEVFARKDPYEDDMDPAEVIRLVADKSVKKRPPIPRSMPEKIKALMSDCLEDDASRRPSFEELDTRLKRIDAESATVVQPNLRSSQTTLFDIFPRHIAETLQRGQTVEPEHKDCVTIFFSDIVGFTTISSELDPRKVADLLDRLYTKLDNLSDKHELFKVETIGDAYMAVTNLVKDQEDDHAKRIAMFAIDAIAAANDTYIDEEDHSKGCVNLRVGFHSGPVVADVVGTRNPRYCLFGDSVNTASRMESHSKANRINCSRASAKLLKTQFPELRLKPRGPIAIKGKGDMQCYWCDEDSSSPNLKEIHVPQVTKVPAPLEALSECSNEFDPHMSFLGELSRSSVAHWPGGREDAASTHSELTPASNPEHWMDEEAQECSFAHDASFAHDGNEHYLHEQEPPNAEEGAPKKTGPFSQLIGRSQKWLRLDEEVALAGDEVSV